MWQGFVNVAFVIDTFARRIFGWRVSRTVHAGFVLDALEKALHDRRPATVGGLITLRGKLSFGHGGVTDRWPGVPDRAPWAGTSFPCSSIFCSKIPESRNPAPTLDGDGVSG